MSVSELQKFTYVSKYAKWKADAKRRETWDECVNSVRDMHKRKYPQLSDEIDSVFEEVRKKNVMPSMRSLQFGGKPIEDKNVRQFNCAGAYLDRLRFFQEAMYILLCGTGVGFSVQTHHVDKLPPFTFLATQGKVLGSKTFVVPDSIEGWADAIGVLISSFFAQPVFPEYQDYQVEFDYSSVRPKGSPLGNSAGKAPGPEPLRNAIEKIRSLLKVTAHLGRLRTIDAYDIVMFLSDAVLSGGVRRSSCLALFSFHDELMMKAKTGDWYYTNPQRQRSNNSVVLIRDKVSYKEFLTIIESIKEYGEPGYYWTDNEEQCSNPCTRLNTLVLTPHGIRTVGDIKEGDKIWSSEGWTMVLKKWKTGTKDVYRYHTTASMFTGTEDHTIVCDGEKVKIGESFGLDRLAGPEIAPFEHSKQAIMDGLVLGDGTRKHGEAGGVNLLIGVNDQDYFSSEIASLIKGSSRGTEYAAYSVTTTLTAVDVPITHLRRIPTKYLHGTPHDAASFLRGVYSANGSICGDRVTLKSVSLQLILEVRTMLSSLGILSYYTTNPPTDVVFANGTYTCAQSYDLNITGDRGKFAELIGFIQGYKREKLRKSCGLRKSRTKRCFEIVKKEYLGVEDVYDITVDNASHTFWCEGSNVSNCVEASFYCYDEFGNSGAQFCNLSAINGKKCKTKEDFIRFCRSAAFIGTLQAGYTKFDYLGEVSERITRREALLGVSITGIMDNPDILLDPKIQKEGAKAVLEENERVAKLIGVNKCARSTLLQPHGTGALFLGCASGIHPHHARRYLRNVKCNEMEAPFQHFKKINSHAYEPDHGSANGTDQIITFPIEVEDGAKIKNEVGALEMLSHVKTTFINWIGNGRNPDQCVMPWLSHNISNTVIVKPDEWEAVAEYIYKNRKHFAGVSLLPHSGDKDYHQAPFTTVYLPNEIVRHYGDASIFASGMIEGALAAFEKNLWVACDVVLGRTSQECDEPKKQWILKAQQFAQRYFGNDLRKMTYCLKDVYNWKKYTDLKRDFTEVDYSQMKEEQDNINHLEVLSCAGGNCEI